MSVLSRFGRKATAVATASVLTAGSVMFGAQAPVARAEDKPTLKLALTGGIETFNPFTTIYATPININRLVYLPIVDYGLNNEPSPGLADKWETSADGKTWTFHFPDGRKWSDGEELTAKDAAYTFAAIKKNATLAEANGSLVTNVVSSEAPDKNTFKLTLKTAQATNPGEEMPIVPEHVWSKLPDPGKYTADASDGKAVVGSGPFVITKYAKEQTVELKANQNFYKGPAKIAGITFINYKNTDAAVAGLQSGEIDLVSGLTPAQFAKLKNTPNIKASQGAGRRYYGININQGAKDLNNQPMGTGNPVLQDPAVRKAIVMGIDKKTIISKVMNGTAKPGLTQVPTVFPDFYGLPDGMEETKFDLEGAKKVLDDAGYKLVDGKRVDKSGKPISLRLMGNSDKALDSQMADFVVGWMKDLGIEIKVEMASSDVTGEKSTKADYDMYFTGWGMGPDPDYQLSINTCASRPDNKGNGATSENNWCDPEFDKLYEAQHVELDKAKRSKLAREAFGKIYQANVLDVLYYADVLEAWRSDRFADFQRQPPNSGPIYGQNSYAGMYSTTPVSASGNESSPSKGLFSNPVTYVIGGIVLLAIIAGVVIGVRGKNRNDDKE